MDFSQLLRQGRESLQITQSQLGQTTGISRRSISDYECGRRIPDKETAQVLGKALRLPAYGIQRATLRAAVSHLCPPRTYSFSRDWTTESRIWKAFKNAPELKPLGKFLTREILSQLNQLPCGSCWEGAVLALLVSLGVQIATVCPDDERYYKHTIIHPLDKLPAGHLRLPALTIVWKGTLVMFIPQVSLEKPKYTLDFLVGVRRRNCPDWQNLEIDGEGHDSAGDIVRTKLIDLPTLRFTPDHLRSPGFAEKLLDAIVNYANAKSSHIHKRAS